MQDHAMESTIRRLAPEAAAPRREAETPECPDSGIPAGAVPTESDAPVAAEASAWGTPQVPSGVVPA
jgi:hypothetical protein